MSSERLRAFQDAATVYESGRRGDIAATSGIGLSLLLFYLLLRWRPPFPFFVEGMLGGAGALIFWRLRRGEITPGKLRQVAATSLGMAAALGALWAYRYGVRGTSPAEWWVVTLLEVGPSQGSG